MLVAMRTCISCALTKLPINQTNQTINPVMFECPIDRCDDCYIVHPLTFSQGKWSWTTHDKALIKTVLSVPR